MIPPQKGRQRCRRQLGSVDHVHGHDQGPKRNGFRISDAFACLERFSHPRGPTESSIEMEVLAMLQLNFRDRHAGPRFQPAGGRLRGGSFWFGGLESQDWNMYDVRHVHDLRDLQNTP